MSMDEKAELRDRVEAKRKELESRLATLRADSRQEARGEAEKLRERLEELDSTLREGWDDLTEAAAAKLNDWLGRS